MHQRSHSIARRYRSSPLYLAYHLPRRSPTYWGRHRSRRFLLGDRWRWKHLLIRPSKNRYLRSMLLLLSYPSQSRLFLNRH